MKSIDQYTAEEVLELLWEQHVDAYAEFYYDSDFDTKEQALLYAEDVLDLFQGFDNPFPIYRTIALGKWADLDKEDLGNHWSFERESAINFAKYNAGGNVLISGMIRKEDVDWELTIKLYKEFSGSYTDSDENEIYVPDTSKVFDVNVEQYTGTKINEIIFQEINKLNEDPDSVNLRLNNKSIITTWIDDDRFFDKKIKNYFK